MKLIIGLGNPGEKYEKTRHNLGFMVVEQFLKDFEPVGQTKWVDEKKFKSDIVELEWQPKSGSLEKVILVKPKTYMNNSGLAVQLLTTYYKLLTTDVWVVHDDVDLPLGSIRIRKGGSSGGHRGVESMIEHLGDVEFWRIRLGIGHPVHKRDGESQKTNMKGVDDFVLGTFSSDEKGKLKHLIKHASEAIQTALEEDLISAMNRFNTK